MVFRDQDLLFKEFQILSKSSLSYTCTWYDCSSHPEKNLLNFPDEDIQKLLQLKSDGQSLKLQIIIFIYHIETFEDSMLVDKKISQFI
ncbi:unnamed protein product [Paramecium sonneborni]|uniref:Uncharacterized protein n=1 Tax=Paramecium sonneborni TaxID=65129 RepID=A0A8S1RBI2_9CILI|nr:unnamed protein product [Paramecium sonneborni]